VNVYKTNTLSHQLLLFHKKQELLEFNCWSHRKFLKQGKDLFAVFQATTGQLADNKWMRGNFPIHQKHFEAFIPMAEMCNPN